MTISENTIAIRNCLDSLDKAQTIGEIKAIFIELESLENDRVSLMSEAGKKWHEAYAAGTDNAYKLIIGVLDRL